MQRIEFSAPLADAKNYPPALIKVNPHQAFSNCRLGRQPHMPELQFFGSGRGALYAAAIALKKAGTNEILLPAYHCPALVEPFMAAGYQIRFYPVAADLTVDIKSLQNLMSESTTHCLLVRYFGYGKGVANTLRWLSERGIITVDDCAHDLQSFLEPQLQADAAICSIRKFIASSDGGALRLKLATASQPMLALTKMPWLLEIKNFLRLLLGSLQQQKHEVQQRQKLQQAMAALTSRQLAVASQPLPEREQKQAAVAPRYLQTKDQEQACYRLTQWQFYQSDLSTVLQRRREHSKALMQGLAASGFGVLLWSELPADVAPYVIPFLLHDSASFDVLRQRGLQVLRWEEAAKTDCAVSADYRRRLIQIPCHQDLSTEQIAYIVRCFC